MPSEGKEEKSMKYGKSESPTSPHSHSSHPTFKPKSHSSPPSHPSPSTPNPAASDPTRLIPPRGDYQTLLSFQKSEIVYDLTFRFAHKFLAKSDRTIDPMIQSARSGKKNILEGSKAGRTSKETELKLTKTAKTGSGKQL